MNEIQELKDALKQSREKCPWSKEQTIPEHLQELIDETKEALQAIENKDNENLTEEFGDILMDLIFIAIVAEEKGLFTLKEITQNATEKLKRRKPWVFGDETIQTKEEAVKRWNEIKKKEKLQSKKSI